jgi:hypothetical protein
MGPAAPVIEAGLLGSPHFSHHPVWRMPLAGPAQLVHRCGIGRAKTTRPIAHEDE